MTALETADHHMRLKYALPLLNQMYLTGEYFFREVIRKNDNL